MALGAQESVTAVADASFLIGLSMIEQFQLLPQMVDELWVAPAEWEEVVDQGRGRPGAEELRSTSFVQMHAVHDLHAIEMLEVFLDRGEAESLVLAQELSCSVVFVDQLRARKVAQRAGLRTTGVAGFLLASKQKGLISEVSPLLDALLQRGFRLSRTIVDLVLREAGEAE